MGTIVTNTGNFRLNEINLKKKGLRASYLISKITQHAKPSSSIKIFEKIVEPILMYNCEVSLAYMAKGWSYGKFKSNMWDVGSEVNKVCLSFLRQLLGVHKKASNLAVLGETGKYPLSIKIFTHILKYWFRIKYSGNKLLKACKDVNVTHDQMGHQNWHKIIRYLLQVTELNNFPNENENATGEIISKFKHKIKTMYDKWWLDKMSSTDNKKTGLVFQIQEIV